jgi:hypothetical protein
VDDNRQCNDALGVDFIGRKIIVNNLRTKDNMLSSNHPAHLRKTLLPTKKVFRVSPCFAAQDWQDAVDRF